MLWARFQGEKAVLQDEVQMKPSWLLREGGVWRSGHEFLVCLRWSSFCTAGSNKASVKYLKERLRGKMKHKWQCCQHRIKPRKDFKAAGASGPVPADLLFIPPRIQTVLVGLCMTAEFDHSDCNSIFSKVAKVLRTKSWGCVSWAACVVLLLRPSWSSKHFQLMSQLQCILQSPQIIEVWLQN